MSDFNPSPYRGDANIGHVSEELFKMYFVGSNVSKETLCKSLWLFFSAQSLPTDQVMCLDAVGIGVCYASGTGDGKRSQASQVQVSCLCQGASPADDTHNNAFCSCARQ